MNLNQMGKKLEETVGKMHVKDPDGDLLYVSSKDGVITATTKNDDPNIEYKPVLLHVVGKDSPPFRRRQAQVQSEMLKLMQEKKLHKQNVKEAQNRDM